MYTFLGTGMHSAFGPFAIVSGVMTGDIVIQVMHELGKDPSASKFETYVPNVLPTGITPTEMTTTLLSVDDPFEKLKNIDIAIMVGLIIGTYILVFGIFRMGFISNFMSEELISGFTTSACALVFVSQLRYLLGADLQHFSGPFNLYYTIEDVFKKLNEVNLTTLTISGVCLAILLFFKLVINPFTSKKGIKTPFPIELCVVIGGTIISNFLDLKSEPYNVNVVNKIGNK